MKALYAYFMKGVPAVSQVNRESEIPWPLSMRWPLGIWRWMFAPDPASALPVVTEDPVIARGAYLVEGLGHCGTCHTPRAITMQEKALSDSDSSHFLAGGAPLEGWVAKNLRGENATDLGTWSVEELVQFLQTGRNDRTAAFGGMSDVIEHSLQHLSLSDLTAIARYLKTLPPSGAAQKPVGQSQTTELLHNLQIQGNLGAQVYADNCMACHRSDGRGYAQTFPGLAGNGVLNEEDPTSVIRIILGGYTLAGTEKAVTAFTMPGFGWRLSDEEVAAVVTFIRSGWGNQGNLVSAKDVEGVRSSMTAAQLAVPGTDVHEGAILPFRP